MTNEKASRILATVGFLMAAFVVFGALAVAVVAFPDDIGTCIGLAGVSYWAAASLIRQSVELLRRYHGDKRSNRGIYTRSF